MATMNVSLPDKMKEWIENRAQQGSYSNVSDYVRDLIRKEQERILSIAAFQNAVDEGIESGVSDRSFDDIVSAAQRRAETAA